MKNMMVLLLFIFYHFDYSAAEEITVVTDNFPPYNYEEGDKIKGLSSEVVQAVVRETGVIADFKMYPWARAYKMAKSEKNTLIYSIARTPERENLFKWVGSIIQMNAYFYKNKTRRDINASKMEDLFPYTVGVMRSGSSQQSLSEWGFKKLEPVVNTEQNIRKLNANRIELLITDEITFIYTVKKIGLAPENFEKVYNLDKLSPVLFMAFSKQTSDRLVDKFRKSLEKVKAEGEYDSILKRYLSSE